MSLSIPADIRDRVNALLGTGRYTSEEELLRAAFAALEEKHVHLLAIGQGIEDMESGRYQSLTEFDAEFRQCNSIAGES